MVNALRSASPPPLAEVGGVRFSGRLAKVRCGARCLCRNSTPNGSREGPLPGEVPIGKAKCHLSGVRTLRTSSAFVTKVRRSPSPCPWCAFGSEGIEASSPSPSRKAGQGRTAARKTVRARRLPREGQPHRRRAGYTSAFFGLPLQVLSAYRDEHPLSPHCGHEHSNPMSPDVDPR